tara:strand:- start:1263 stop:1427 length:165 start_codon:yes stop_codon:yes gene_type:complete
MVKKVLNGAEREEHVVELFRTSVEILDGLEVSAERIAVALEEIVQIIKQETEDG